MSDRDYYEILGLTPRADGAMVDQAYWHLARKYQALAATNARAQFMLDELNEAYGVLGNPNLRQQYDAFRDDVLVRRGMIKPVRSRPEPKVEAAASREETAAARLPHLRLRDWPTYATSSVIVALALAAAASGVNVGFVAGALAVGLAFALVPTVRRRVADIHITMPSMAMPSVAMPSMQAPKLSLPAMPEIGAQQALRELGIGNTKGEAMDPDELRVSTAATIARWRASIGLRSQAAEDAPDTTLVDIVAGERDLEQHDEPLEAVLDILRGAHRSTGAPK
ncbi:MAG TPA: J domain-containing protein [Dehalococcoidia bacterium]|jgi:nitroreductase